MAKRCIVIYVLDQFKFCLAIFVYLVAAYSLTHLVWDAIR